KYNRALEGSQVNLPRTLPLTCHWLGLLRTYPLSRVLCFPSPLLCLLSCPRPPKAVTIRTKASVRVNREFLVPIARPALVGGRVPGAATEHAHLAGRRPARVLGRAFRVVALAVPVVAPLPNVAVHVVKAPVVGQLLTHRVRLALRVRLEPAVSG